MTIWNDSQNTKWDCANCSTCERRCVHRLASQLHDAGAELVHQRGMAECRERAQWMRDWGYLLIGMTASPIYSLFRIWWPWIPSGELAAAWSVLLYGGLSLLLLLFAPSYERWLRKRWSPSRG